MMKVERTGTTPDKPPHIEATTGETRQQCFMRHYNRCVYKVGDNVVFKRPKRNKLRGVVDHIETDISKMFWSDGGKQPRYIRVAMEYIDRETGEIKPTHVWVCESKLLMGDMRK